MSFNNYNQQNFGGQQMPPQQEHPKVDRKLVTGRITQEPEVNITNSGKPVLNLRFRIDNSQLPDGGQWATATFWENEAYFIAATFKKHDAITLSGVVTWKDWSSGDKSGKNLEYDYATVYLGANQVLDLIRNEITFALEQATTVSADKVVETTSKAVEQPQTQPQPTPTVEEEFDNPTLDISSDDLPF